MTHVSGLSDAEWKVLENAALSNGVTLLLVGLLVWSAFKFRAWYREDTGPADDPHELLLLFKDMQRQGDLTDEEYRSIRGRLTGEVADDSAASTDTPSGTDAKA
jgi:hypothetical protein